MFKIELSASSIFRLQYRDIGAIAALVLISLLSSWSGTPHHHTLSNSWEGLIWGLADPVISFDCLVGIVALGLLSAGIIHSTVIVISFVLAAFLGIVIHLSQINLSGIETAIAVSTIASGTILAISEQRNLIVVSLLGAIAGLFQGYVHAESIINVEIMPLIAYILGMALTQFAILMSAKVIAMKSNLGEINQVLQQKFRLLGFAFCAIGMVFLQSYIYNF